MGCQDCNNNEYFHKIKPIQSFEFGVDTKMSINYTIIRGNGVGVFNNEYYIDVDFYNNDDPFMVELIDNGFNISNTTTLSEQFIFSGIFNDYQSAKLAVDNAPLSPNIVAITTLIENSNYGNPIQSHPSILKHNYGRILDQYGSIPREYNSLSHPIWFLKFPLCLNDKDKGENLWKLDKCGTWEINFKLRLRPLIFLFLPWQSYPREDEFDFFKNLVNETITEEHLLMLYNFHTSLREQYGSKKLGITPMYIEVGIFNTNHQTYKPILWSDSKYPQVSPNGVRNYWSVDNPDKIIAKNTTPQSYKISANISADYNLIKRVYGVFDPPLYYSYINDDLYKGFIKPNSNTITSVTSIQFHYKSQKEGGIMETGNINDFDLISKLKSKIMDINDTNNPFGDIDIDIKKLVDGDWVYVMNISYSIGGYTLYDNYVEFNNLTNPYVIVYNNSLAESTTMYWNSNNPQTPTRYEINFNLDKTYSNIPKLNVGTSNISNYTKLSEEFVFEMEGFTNVDIDNSGGEVMLYLKVLPAHTSKSELKYSTANINIIQQDRRLELPLSWNPLICNSNVRPMISNCEPWGQLSVDDRTGYEEQPTVYYEPLRPLRQEYIDDDNKIYTNDDISQLYRWGYKFDTYKHSGWYIMIEDGWIKSKKIKDCC